MCLWPYDEMYNAEGVRKGEGFDYDERLERAREFWSRIEPDRSLIVYYANHSNPFSEEDAKRYVIVGISRVKAIGEIMFYEGCSESVRQKYGGGFVWQLPVTSHYPDQGFRLPYHLYLDQPDLLAKISLRPGEPQELQVCHPAVLRRRGPGARRATAREGGGPA